MADRQTELERWNDRTVLWSILAITIIAILAYGAYASYYSEKNSTNNRAASESIMTSGAINSTPTAATNPADGTITNYDATSTTGAADTEMKAEDMQTDESSGNTAGSKANQ